MRFAGAKLRKKTEVFYDSNRAIFIFISFFQLADFRYLCNARPMRIIIKKASVARCFN